MSLSENHGMYMDGDLRRLTVVFQLWSTWLSFFYKPDRVHEQRRQEPQERLVGTSGY